ncbi:NIPSNAP protein [Paraburkholderia sp. BL8N3]|nr:NIPSNAP family protein [Paraburkholderia sp. BL8N3]TCK35061.1 NIPSNAP protein [Paraburkholderia sp. BL8N3]
MLVDLRRYTIVPGQLKAYLQVYETYGLPIQRRHVGDPLGYFISEVGTLNQVVHLWGYRDFEDRQTGRAAMEADPDWTAYKKMTAEGRYIQQQENQLVMSVPWSKI